MISRPWGSGRLVAALVACFVLLSVTNTFAQPSRFGWHWKQIGKFSPYNQLHIQCVYFSNAQTGLVSYFDPVLKYPLIYRTTDQGKNWVQCKTPVRAQTLAHSIVGDFYFLDGKNGYAAFSGLRPPKSTSTLSGVWRTSDGGLTWIEGPDSVYLTNDVHIGINGQFVRSSGGIAVKNEMIMVRSAAALSDYRDMMLNFERTTDGGRTWEWVGPFTSQTNESWGIYYHKWNNTFYFMSEVKPANLHYSTDDGVTWDTIPHYNQIKGATSGEIRGTGNVMYMHGQTLFRSTDGGRTFVDVGGPSASGDSRFSVPPSCHGGVVVVAHNDGTLWMTTTGGDGTIPREPREHLSASIAPIESIECTTKEGTFALTNITCHELVIESLEIVDQPDNFVLGTISYPIKLAPDTVARIPVAFYPEKDSNAINGRVRIKGYLFQPGGYMYVDTIMSLKGRVIPGQIGIEADRSAFNFGEISNCTDCDTTITITNYSCDSVTLTHRSVSDPSFVVAGLELPVTMGPQETREIRVQCAQTIEGRNRATVLLEGIVHDGRPADSVKITLEVTKTIDAPQLAVVADTIDLGIVSLCAPKDTLLSLSNIGCDSLTLDLSESLALPFSLIGDTSPYQVAMGNSQNVTVRFAPEQEGQFTQTIKLSATRGSKQTPATLVIKGVGVIPEPALSVAASTLEFNSTALCGSDSVKVTLSNLSCKDIAILSTQLTGDPDFSLSSRGSSIAAGASEEVWIKLDPSQSGPRASSLQITTMVDGASATKDTVLAISAMVLAGERIVTASQAAIQFDETSICEDRDTTITIRNAGCDTVTITSADISKDFAIENDLALPQRLLPGDSLVIDIVTVTDTSGGRTQFDGQLVIGSNADSPIAPIVLSRSIYYPTKLRIEALGEGSGKAGELITFRVILEGALPKSATALHFDLHHDNDLLSYESHTGDLQLTATSGNADQLQRFTLTPLTDVGVIGELTFKAFLASSESTEFTFSNIRLESKNVTLAQECLAIISDSGSVFRYVYSCGDGMLRDYLKNDRILITSLRPNPAQHEIQLDLRANSATVLLFDQLGAEALRETTTGTHHTLDVSTLPSGSYYLRVSTLTNVQTRRVVIER